MARRPRPRARPRPRTRPQSRPQSRARPSSRRRVPGSAGLNAAQQRQAREILDRGQPPTTADPEGIRGRTSIAAIERDPKSQEAIQRFQKAFPNIPDTKKQLYSLVAGESGFRSDSSTITGQYSGYFQLGSSEAYKGMGLTKAQFADLPFHQQLDAYAKWIKRNDPSGENIKNLGLFNAASNMKLQGQSDDTVVYRAGSAAARANRNTWGRYSNAGGNVTIGGIKRYYNRADPASEREISAAQIAMGPGFRGGRRVAEEQEITARGEAMMAKPDVAALGGERLRSMSPEQYSAAAPNLGESASGRAVPVDVFSAPGSRDISIAGGLGSLPKFEPTSSEGGRELDGAGPSVKVNGSLDVSVKGASPEVTVKTETEGELFNKTETTREIEPMGEE